jgi:D-sedoheptulose 7-phosphate isomerase
MNWINNISTLENCLKSLSARDESGNETDSDSAFMQWKDRSVWVRENRKTVYLIGNGASASMASHFAADLAKNGQVRTEIFTDLSLITAVANDINYESVFAEPLRWRMTEGDNLK